MQNRWTHEPAGNVLADENASPFIDAPQTIQVVPRENYTGIPRYKTLPHDVIFKKHTLTEKQIHSQNIF